MQSIRGLSIGWILPGLVVDIGVWVVGMFEGSLRVELYGFGLRVAVAGSWAVDKSWGSMLGKWELGLPETDRG